MHWFLQKMANSVNSERIIGQPVTVCFCFFWQILANSCPCKDTTTTAATTEATTTPTTAAP